MDLLEDDFDADYDIGNDDGVKFGDIYYLNYHGINVFFYVCGLDKHRVRIFELAKKRKEINGEKAEYLTLNLNPTASPKVVLDKNCWTKSEFWVETNKDGEIIVPITMGGPLWNSALKLGVKYPAFGYAYAIPLKEQKKNGICNYYWLTPKPIKNKKINKNKISA